MPAPLLTIASAGINLGDRWLLRNADLTLHAGDRLALVGRNGAGKSSLMKLMAGRPSQSASCPAITTLRSVMPVGNCGACGR